MTRALLAFALTLSVAAAAPAALREDIGPAKAAAIESAFAAAMPGSVLQWAETLSVTAADGASSAVRIIGPEPFGTMWVMHVELTDFAKAAVVHARTYSKEPAPQQRTDFLAAVPATGAPRIVRLDPTSISIEVKQLDVVPEYDVPQTWPAVSVTYWAQYGTTDWVGSVRWSGAYDLQMLRDASRMPLGITKRRATGEGISEQVAATRATAEIVEIEGGQSRQVVQYPCPIPCTFDGKSLLAAWSVTAAAPVTE